MHTHTHTFITHLLSHEHIIVNVMHIRTCYSAQVPFLDHLLCHTLDPSAYELYNTHTHTHTQVHTHFILVQTETYILHILPKVLFLYGKIVCEIPAQYTLYTHPIHNVHIHITCILHFKLHPHVCVYTTYMYLTKQQTTLYIYTWTCTHVQLTLHCLPHRMASLYLSTSTQSLANS